MALAAWLMLVGHLFAKTGTPIEFSILENGMEVLYVENHANPVVASVVIVKTGLRNETPAINGASHYLEHLLFNGTKKRTQKQLYDEMDFIGGYNNAHTDWDYTDFMVLAPKEHFETALDIQSDMLFNSTILPEKFKKERKIVLEEIARDLTQPSYRAEEFFNSIYFKGTIYAYPVLGTYQSLANTTRDDVFRYYKSHYVPNNMVAVLIGDFSTSKMKELVKKYFGPYPPGDVPASVKITPKSIRSQAIFVTHEEVKQPLLSIGIPAPRYTSSDYYAFDLLNAVLNEKLQEAFQKGGQPQAFQIYSDYQVHPDLSLLKIDATLAPGVAPSAAVKTIEGVLRDLRDNPVSETKLRHLKNSIRSENTYLFERPHYFGMMKATSLYLGGYDFLNSYDGKIQSVSPWALQQVARKYFSNIKPVVTVVKPQPKESRKNKALVQVQFRKKILGNGLTVIVASKPGSDVTGFHILVKNRLLMEPPGKNGITEVLHYLLGKGTRHLSKQALEDTLEAMGTHLKLHDNPYIPYDNYYLSPFYSYIRMEALHDFELPSLNILADIVENPLLKVRDLQAVKKQLAAQARHGAGSARSLASRLFFRKIFRDSLLARPVLGNPVQIESISENDIQRYYKGYFTPSNLILTVVTSTPADKILAAVEKAFGSWQASPVKAVPNPALTQLAQSIRLEKKLGQSQSFILIGKPLGRFTRGDLPALMVANAILSSKLAFHLREQKGWAYSIGSSVSLDKLPYFVVTMGTRPQNLTAASKALQKEIFDFPKSRFSQKEVQKSVNQLIGRYLMRQLPRENQAYFLGLSEYAYGDFRFWTGLFDQLKRVSPEDVRRAAARYLGSGPFVTIVVR